MSEHTRDRLLALLRPGEFVSGRVLGEELRISRAAVHKHMLTLRRQGLPVHRVPGRGYRLPEGIRLLDAEAIGRGLDADIAAAVIRVSVLQRVDSTNRWLQGRRRAHGHVCAAEAQLHGRGRRENAWVASPYRNVLFSLGYEFQAWPETITALALAASVAVARALHRFSVAGVGIKWPNDLIVDFRKLGGILVDVSGESGGRCAAIIGVGINAQMEESDAAPIDQPWTDLRKVTGSAIDRNTLIALCASELLRMLPRFERAGFREFRADWERLHRYTGRRIQITDHRGEHIGIVIGSNAQGALLVQHDNGRTRPYLSGDVRLRNLA